MILQNDYHALNGAMMIFGERGCRLPWTARLADPQRTEVALAGLRLSQEGRPVRMCVTFSLPPSPPATGMQPGAAETFASSVSPQLGTGQCKMGLLEVQDGAAGVAGRTLEALAPDAMTSEIGPGRFGVMEPAARGPDLGRTAPSLEDCAAGPGRNYHSLAGEPR